MAMTEAGGDGFEFLSDPINRFPRLDLAAGESLLRNEGNQSLVCTVAQSSHNGVGGAAVTVQVKFDSGSNGWPCRIQSIRHAKMIHKHLAGPTGFACRTAPPVNPCWTAKQIKLWHARALNPAFVMWAMQRRQHK